MAITCLVQEQVDDDNFSTSIRTRNSSSLQSTLASLESLSMPMVHEVVLLADFKCKDCQKRIADIISKTNRFNGKTESMIVSILERKVTLICRYPVIGKVASLPSIFTKCKKSFNKCMKIPSFFCYSSD
ncbi:uncharacterized protein LOC124913434 [Impatiens glandulifera]|uniref:uncharacterized protein LOC124913434 n=1 Tax=Impatiens glandulifera TaxID=253017 RepID=UPI001FB06C97|nr:uncharacterized protein LOC124913434 [Impatiens glandulifera]